LRFPFDRLLRALGGLLGRCKDGFEFDATSRCGFAQKARNVASIERPVVWIVLSVSITAISSETDCGFASTLPMLVSARLIQGAGAAGVSVAGVAFVR
jgi:MFS family permease